MVKKLAKDEDKELLEIYKNLKKVKEKTKDARQKINADLCESEQKLKK